MAKSTTDPKDRQVRLAKEDSLFLDHEFEWQVSIGGYKWETEAEQAERLRAMGGIPLPAYPDVRPDTKYLVEEPTL